LISWQIKGKYSRKLLIVALKAIMLLCKQITATQNKSALLISQAPVHLLHALSKSTGDAIALATQQLLR
jgi:hypothetical protein